MLNTLYASDVRQTLDDFRRSVDQMFDSFAWAPTVPVPSLPDSKAPADSIFSPVVENAWTENELRLRVVVPGVQQGDINVNLQGNQLLISGERRLPDGFRQKAYTQIHYGRFATAVTLPSGLEFDRIRCDLHNGMLDIAIPVAESMKPRQIPVQFGNSPKAISS